MKNYKLILFAVLVVMGGCVKADMGYMDNARPPRGARRQSSPGQRVAAKPNMESQYAPAEITEPKAATKVPAPFFVYKDDKSSANKYLPTGWMGDIGDIKVKNNCNINTNSGPTCVEISYSGKGTNGAGWAGVYWQNPANNWGTVKGGYDLSGMTKLTFYARGKEGMENAEFKIGGIQGEYSDSVTATTGNITLTNTWKKYELDLSGMDLSYVSGGFMWVTSSVANPDGATIYLDDILYTNE